MEEAQPNFFYDICIPMYMYTYDICIPMYMISQYVLFIGNSIYFTDIRHFIIVRQAIDHRINSPKINISAKNTSREN